MIKLLKYDWKRSSDGILSTLAILIIMEAALSITGYLRNWDDGVVIPLSIFGYVMVMVLLFIHCCRTFDSNIKSFSRRLLPLHPIQGIGALILLSWIVLLLVTAVAAIHVLLYTTLLDINMSEIVKLVEFSGRGWFGVALSGLWTYTVAVIAILASITVAGSFHYKRTAWIGIIFFFVVQSVAVWLENILFNQNESSFGVISVNSSHVESSGVSFESSFTTNFLVGPFLLDLVITASLVALMVYLLNKKVDL